MGSLIILRLSELKNVLYVKGPTVNLISVSQLCDEDLYVQFTKDKYIVLNQNQCQIMEGERFSDNFYLLTSTNTYMNVLQKNLSIGLQQSGHASSNKNTLFG